MNNNNDGPSASDKLVIDRESRKLDNQKAKLEAFKRNMSKAISEGLKNERNRQSIAKDALYATERSKRGDHDSRLQDVSNVGGSTFSSREDDLITGLEPLPWEKDDSWE